MWRCKKWFFRGDCNNFFLFQKWVPYVDYWRYGALESDCHIWKNALKSSYGTHKKIVFGRCSHVIHFFSISLSMLSRMICTEYFVQVSDGSTYLVTLESQKKVSKNQKSWKWPKMTKKRSAYNFFLKILFLFFFI